MKRANILLFLIVLLFLFIIINITLISAIRINEVELNPAGTDSGNEWLELYSESHFNLNNLIIMNVRGKNISLNGSFSGFFIVNTPYSFLANEKQKLVLFNDNEKIDETPEITDKADDNRSWQLCEEWIFAESSKEKDNNCEKEENKTSEENNEVIIENNSETKKTEKIETRSKKTSAENIKSNINTTPIITETSIIKLIPKDIKSYKSKTQYIKEYAIYCFVCFCIMLFIMLIIKIIKK
ncbi:hypothetical protein FJZ19_00390 [Candidatus Pacearchaeota archaeon]|nr:hypothetical protein [Candidatus Pacearchaeota archaeon]